MREIHWFESKPGAGRAELLEQRRNIPEAERQRMMDFGEAYFDGDSVYGYGGFHYDGRYAGVVGEMKEFYGLTPESRVLDIGCAKGFLLYEFQKLGIASVHGIDISEYAVANAPEPVRDALVVGSADDLGRWPDGWFDLVISRGVLHNLPPEAADRALAEMVRVTGGNAYLVVGSYETERQREDLVGWTVTIATVRSRQQWLEAFSTVGYDYDYSLFIPSTEQQA